MKKILLVSACVLGMSVATPVDAMMKNPTNVCEFLQYMDQKMDVMASALNQRLDQMDSRLNKMEKSFSDITIKAGIKSDDIERIKETIGFFESSSKIQKNYQRDPVRDLSGEQNITMDLAEKIDVPYNEEDIHNISLVLVRARKTVRVPAYWGKWGKISINSGYPVFINDQAANFLLRTQEIEIVDETVHKVSIRRKNMDPYKDVLKIKIVNVPSSTSPASANKNIYFQEDYFNETYSQGAEYFVPTEIANLLIKKGYAQQVN